MDLISKLLMSIGLGMNHTACFCVCLWKTVAERVDKEFKL